MNKLDVGCGNSKHPGCIGIDKIKNTQADIVHDLDQYPWPIEDNTYDEIICNDVLEHLDNVVKALEELHRIGKKCAVIKIRVPHFSNYNGFSDITHKHTFGVQSLDGFVGKSFTQSHYSEKRFELLSIQLTFGKLYKLVGMIANKYQLRYERYFAFIFPAGNIEFQLKIIK
jgi:predicted SAM-dependent methyltransferase